MVQNEDTGNTHRVNTICRGNVQPSNWLSKKQKGFPWLVNIKKNSKEMALVLSEVIMENFDDSFGSGFKGQGLYLVFYF